MTDLDAFLLLCLACGSVFCAGFLGRLAGRAEGWNYGFRAGRRQGRREAEEEHRERIMHNHGDN